MGKKVLVFLGHSNDQSLCAGLAQAYADACQKKGGEVRLVRLSQLQFSPTFDFDAPNNLEPDMKQLQSSFSWANHIAMVYPIWWGAAPGLMKCALERVLLPGFAFKFHSKGFGWDRMLSSRTSELIVTLDTPPLIYRWIYGAAGDRVLARRTLDFCGMKCVRTTHFGPVRSADEKKRLVWIDKVKQLGRDAA
jgi:putative NADPH-quinone reductase